MGQLIGIGGVSRAGKSRLSGFLYTNLDSVRIISQDDFVKHKDEIPKIHQRIDWEHPSSIDWLKLKGEVLSSLKENRYTILDGLFAFFDPELTDKMSCRCFLSIDKEEFLKRKKEDARWGKEPSWFIEHIWNSHQKFGLPPAGINFLQFHNINKADYQTALDFLKAL